MEVESNESRYGRLSVALQVNSENADDWVEIGLNWSPLEERCTSGFERVMDHLEHLTEGTPFVAIEQLIGTN